MRGDLVRLEPLAQEHAQGLYNRGRTADDWSYMPRSCFIDMADVRQWIEEALEAPYQLPFGALVLSHVFAVVIEQIIPIKNKITSFFMFFPILNFYWYDLSLFFIKTELAELRFCTA